MAGVERNCTAVLVAVGPRRALRWAKGHATAAGSAHCSPRSFETASRRFLERRNEGQTRAHPPARLPRRRNDSAAREPHRGGRVQWLQRAVIGIAVLVRPAPE